VSRVISVRLRSEEAANLERLARQFGRSLGAAASLLLREKLKEEEFPFIEFRNTLVGRQAFVKGTGLAVWEVLFIARGLDMDVARVADHLGCPEEKVQAALAYAETYPDEIDPLVAEVESADFETLKRKIPWIREARV
jgi:uncharacterized protein (DUF433 family)